MFRRDKETSEFDELITISSNIKANKRAIIGKFDLRDLLFLCLGGLIGILVLTIVVLIFHMRSVILILIVLAIFEVPIITLGFMKVYNMPYLEYLKLKSKSNNSKYRNQTLNRKISEKYAFTMEIKCTDFTDLLDKTNTIIDILKSKISFKRIQYKIYKERVYLTIAIDSKKINFEDMQIEIIEMLKALSYVKSLNSVDVNNYSIVIAPLLVCGKKYTKGALKKIEKAKNVKLGIKDVDNKKPEKKYVDLDYIDFLLSSYREEFIKVYKIILYKYPIEIGFIDELKQISEITLYLDIESQVNLASVNFLNTFILINAKKENMEDKMNEVKSIFSKYNILYKTIDDEGIKSSITLSMKNRF